MNCPHCATPLESNAKFCPKCGNSVTPPPTPQPAPAVPAEVSSIWPEWQIIKQLGKGSYGVVYQAVRKDNNVESHAAIKVISIPSDSSEVDSLRSEGLDFDGTKTYFQNIVNDFVGEIQLMESLKGIQNIVSVEDYKVIPKTEGIGWDIYIRMELLTPFNTYISDKTLSEQEVIGLGCDICTALEICNQRNIIHRDIKPENIFVNDFGYFKLGDFGIARKLENVTGGLSQKGTYNYMAPEVASGTSYDARVDTYSLGIVLYRLLNNNKLPFLDTQKQLLSPNERKMAVERRLGGEPLPLPANASPEMANLILRACAPNPEHRFASATQMKEALKAVANGSYTMENIPLASVSAENSPAFSGPSQGAKPVVDSFDQQPTPENPKKKKAKAIAISIVAGITALAIFLTVFFFSSAAYGVYKDLTNHRSQEAVTQYQKDVKDRFIQETLLNLLVNDTVADIAKEFEAGTLDYDTAIAQLTALNQMGVEGAEETMNTITAANDSANALEKAQAYYQQGDYQNAILEYAKVPQSNKNYQEAQNKITEISPQYINSVINTAQNHNQNKQYKEAVSYIKTAYDILPASIDKSQLDTVKADCMAAYKTDLSTTVTGLVTDGDFTGAFQEIEEAIAFDDDQYFKDLRTATQQKYVASVTADVNKHLKNEDYISAKRVAENALTVLPGNADLTQLKTKVEAETPTYLLDVVKPYETLKTYNEYINGESFKMGGTSFTNGFLFSAVGRLSAGSGKASFNLNGAYTELSFYLGTVDGKGAVTNTLLVYCDDILEAEYTIHGGKLPQKHTIDITGVKQLTFIINGTNDGCTYGFGNVTVK